MSKHRKITSDLFFQMISERHFDLLPCNKQTRRSRHKSGDRVKLREEKCILSSLIFIRITFHRFRTLNSVNFNEEGNRISGESRQVRLADFEIDRNPAQVGATGASRRTVSTIPRWYS